MKQLFFKLFLLFSIIFFNFGCNSVTNNKAIATAMPVNGIYVFIRCKPTSAYDFLGTVELKWYDKLLQNNQQNLVSMIDNLTSILSFSGNLINSVNEVKQKYPSADGVIFDDDMSRCEAIKFKD